MAVNICHRNLREIMLYACACLPRRTGERMTEEIDIVGTAKGRVTVIGEYRWRNLPPGTRRLEEPVGGWGGC
jgi:hypothetical protein